MTMPAGTPGDRRENHAQAVADAVTVAVAGAELALIVAVARLARKVATGSMDRTTAARKLRGEAHRIILASLPRIRTALNRASIVTRNAAMREAATTFGGRIQPALGADWETPLSQRISDALGAAEQSAQDALSDAAAAATAAGRAPTIFERAAGNTLSPPTSLSRIQAVQKALDEFAARGITGFTDSAGRNWNLTSYVEMAVRTSVSNAWDDMQAQAMRSAGIDLIWTYTTSTEGSCPLCIPWLGKLLSLTGSTPGFPTLAQAKAAGFRHPNCRCSWMPEAGGIAPGQANAATARAARAYAASQQWRSAQRKSRAASRAASAAITPRARSAARAKIAAAQS